jgi:hypothetical protein
MERPKIPQKYLFIADKVYKRKGLYRSAYALRLALENDSKFKKDYEEWLKSKDKTTSGIQRWLKEKWILVRPYIETGEIIKCGNRSDSRFPTCRPLIRITKDTPITIKELLEKTTKEKIMEEIRKKEKNPDYRINWEKIE